MKGRDVLLAQPVTDVWATPQWLYDALDKEFGFTLDPCTDGTNAKCAKFFTPTDNGLLRDWGTDVVFMKEGVRGRARRRYGRLPHPCSHRHAMVA